MSAIEQLMTALYEDNKNLEKCQEQMANMTNNQSTTKAPEKKESALQQSFNNLMNYST